MTISGTKTLKSILLAATILASPLILAAAAPTSALAQVSLGVSVQVAPPPLPVYDQPPMPDVGYLWTPGYWAWADPTGYYWVPGTWVQPPTVGFLWTPPYWGWVNGAYVFNDGYWGSHVGFYGGVDYGYGYGGRGYEGGRWNHDNFVYNRSANNFGSVHVANTYTQNVTVINNTHVSYVGGTGGIHARPTAAENAALHETHAPVTAEQTHHVEMAKSNPDFAANRNKGHPAIAATSRPAQFEGAGVTPTRAASGPAIRPRPDHAAAAHGPAINPRPDHAAAAPGPAIKPRRDNTAATPGAAIKPQPDHAAAAPGPAIKPRPDHAAAAQAAPARPMHPASAQAAPVRPTHAAAAQAAPARPARPASAQAAPARPAHPATAQAAPARPTHPAAARTAEPRPPQAAAHAAPQRPAAEPDKKEDKKPD